MCNEEIKVSSLNKTWILDLDGTIVKHNGYLIDGVDTLLPDIEKFLSQMNDNDFVVIVTARRIEYREQTEQFLREHNIRYDAIIWNTPNGERILVNDIKPNGLHTAIAINTVRNEACKMKFIIDDNL